MTGRGSILEFRNIGKNFHCRGLSATITQIEMSYRDCETAIAARNTVLAEIKSTHPRH
jgi:hypothetical protein